MLTKKVTSDKIHLGYRIFFERAKEIYLRYSKQKIFPITLLTFLCIFILLNSAHAGWSEPARISPPDGCSNPQLISSGDTLHVIYRWDGGNYPLNYQRSTDAGITWNAPQALIDSHLVEFPRLIKSGSRIMAIWKRGLSGYYRYTIQYCVSTNNGQSWSTFQNAINPGSPEDILFAASGGNGLNINIVYCTYETDSMTFYSVRSTNFGQSWSVATEIFRAAFSSVPDQISFHNLVHFVWPGFFSYSENEEIYYLRSIDAGITWSANIPLSTDDNYGAVHPVICDNIIGGVRTSWMDGKYSPYMLTGDILTRGSADSGSTWSIEEQATFNHFAFGANDIALAGDTIHIVWEDAGAGLANRSIYYTQSIDNGGTWSEPYWIDGTLDASADPAIAISNGKVFVVWTDGRANPDTNIIGGLYVSIYDPEPDAIHESDNPLPKGINLAAYPNPFNSSVTITYSNLKGGEIDIYDIQGKLIKTLKTNGGENGKIIWDACDASGNRVSSGEYFLKAGASHNSSDLKLLYLK